MKKLFIVLTIIIGISFALTVFAYEKIDNFEVEIQINQDSSIDVTEKIIYDFGADQRHGIFRTIPIKYKARGGNFNLRISNINVVDENQNPYKFTTTYPSEYVKIKIGDADIYVTGAKTYIINYKIKRAINYFTEHDELYWNVTGNEWPVEINNTKATVYLPQFTGSLEETCFAGFLGEDEECDSHEIIVDEENSRYGAVFTEESLISGEGLTVVMSFDKEIVVAPSLTEKFIDMAIDNWIIGLPIIVFIIFYYLWYTRGKDPEGRGTIIAQFEAPDNLSPAQIGTIVDERVNNKDISAEIITLAVNGYITIERTAKGKIFKTHDYILTKLKDTDDKLNGFQKELLNGIFSSKDVKKLSDLDNTFYTKFRKIRDDIYKSTVTDKYFIKHPQLVRSFYFGVAIAFFILTSVIGPLFGVIGTVSIAFSGLIALVFSFFMPKKTKKGAITLEHIMGLKKYITVAEKDRIKFHNAPEKNPKHFEKLLPFAMVLGAENQWAKQFESIYKNQTPSWYSDANTANFNSFSLINNLGNFTNKASASLSSAPASSGASGGSSGFSGGGFGGGGGGSW